MNWIDVNERLPPFAQRVLVISRCFDPFELDTEKLFPFIFVADWDCQFGWMVLFKPEKWTGVTHWCPYPSLPEKYRAPITPFSS